MPKKKANRRRPAKKRKPAEEDGYKRPSLISLFLFWPYHVVGYTTRNWPAVLRRPLKLGALGITLGFISFLLMAAFYAARAMPYNMADIRVMPARSVVLDRYEQEIGRLHGENRSIIPLAQVAPVFQDALLAREDKRFRSHFGVDPFGVARSIIENIKRRSLAQGSSTITMQLARNSFDLRSQTLEDLKVPGAFIELDRKFLEIAVSFRIEANHTKDEILESYINRIFWGHSYRGVETAAQNYFGKPASELTLSEAAMLAGIIRGPNAFTPHRYPDKAKRERDSTLDSMVRYGFITAGEAEAAKRAPLRIKPITTTKTGWSFNIISAELEEVLPRKALNQGGLTIITTLDATLQKITEQELESQLASIERRPGYRHPTREQWKRNPAGAPPYLEGSVVLLDTRTGAVRAVAGGRNLEESQFNRAKNTNRQIGSTFKPFVFLAAYEEGLLPESWVKDTPVSTGEVPGARAGWPQNADGKYYELIRTKDALIQSRNASTVRVGTFAGLDKVIKVARSAGLLAPPTEDPTFYLGNAQASPWQLAAAYTTFPNEGSRVRPYLIDRILDAEGEVLWKTAPLKQVVSRPEPAAMVHNLLKEATISGTSASMRSTYGFREPAGGKTGTTNDYKDAWFVGYTSSLTGAVWVGLDQPATIIDRGYGGTLALPIWARIMRKATALRTTAGDHRYPTGEMEPDLVYQRAQLCRISGKRATQGCHHAGTAYSDYVPENSLPAANDFCPVHPIRAEPVSGNSGGGQSPVLVRPNTPPPIQRAIPVEEEPLRAIPVE
ncbi:MAG: transglycosylase domain-containing protein [Verrucomicrobiota bacterium JB023]|nr:transglycosylase domain-containing protein [Verrucomicrobiota bacterium JB023]